MFLRFPIQYVCGFLSRVQGALGRTLLEKEDWGTKNQVIVENIRSIRKENKIKTDAFGILIICRFVKKQKEKAFAFIGDFNRKMMKFGEMLKILTSKERNHLNSGFSAIQK